MKGIRGTLRDGYGQVSRISILSPRASSGVAGRLCCRSEIMGCITVKACPPCPVASRGVLRHCLGSPVSSVGIIASFDTELDFLGVGRPRVPGGRRGRYFYLGYNSALESKTHNQDILVPPL